MKIERRECFNVLKTESNFTDILINLFKTDSPGAKFNDFNAYFHLAKLNNWVPSDIEISEEYYDSIDPHKVDCNHLISAYKSLGITEYCYLCNLSPAYRNKNINEEEQVISYIMNNKDAIRALKKHDIKIHSFSSLKSYMLDGKFITVNILVDFYKVLADVTLKKPTVIISKTEFLNDSIFVESHKYKNSTVRSLLDSYYDYLIDNKVDKKSFESALSTISGIGASFKKPVRKTTEEAYIIIPEAEGEVLTLLDNNKEKHGSHMHHSVNNDDKFEFAKLIIPKSMEIIDENICNSLEHTEEITIETNSKDLKVEDLFTIAPVDIYIDQDCGDFDTSNIILIDNLESFSKHRNSIATCTDIVFVPFLPSSKLLFRTFDKEPLNTYLMDMNPELVESEFKWLLSYKGVNKIFNNIVTLGSYVDKQILGCCDIFELMTAEYVFDQDLFYGCKYGERVKSIEENAFSESDINSYINCISRIYKRYTILKEHIHENKLEDMYNTMLSITQLAAISMIRTDDFKYLSVRILNDQGEIHLNESYHDMFGLYKCEKPGFIMECSLINILKSRFTLDIDVKIKHYSDNYLVIGTRELHIPILFDTLNQYIINTFKEIVKAKLSPNIEILFL